MNNDPTNGVHPPYRHGAGRNAAWNYAGYAYQIGINFGLTAYIVRQISVAEYGLYLLVISLSATLNLFDLGISGVLVQRYVHAVKHADQEMLSNLISTAFVALAGLAALGAVAFCLLAVFLPGPFRIPQHLLHEAAMIFVITACALQIRLPAVAFRQAYQAFHRFDRINQIQLFTSTLQTGLAVWALYAGYGIAGLAFVQLISAAVQICMLYIGLPRVARGVHVSGLRFSRKVLVSIVADGKWAFLSNITGYVVEIAIWGILGSLGSMTEIALYGIAWKAPNQLWNLTDRGADVLLPVLSGYSAMDDTENLRRIFLKTQQLIFGAVLPFVMLGLFFAAPLLEVWAGKQYLHGAVAMRWLLIAVLAHAVAYSSDLLLYACGKFKRAAWMSAIGGLVIIVGSIVLVPRYGAAGVGIALAASQLVIDCGWFTVAACRLSRTSMRALCSGLFRGLGVPVLVLAAEIALISSFRSILSPVYLLAAASLSGCVYFLLWGLRTALPLYRNRAEMVA